MNKKRPVNLDLATMKFPVMAIVSILHRISGIVLFLLMPVLLYGLDQSLNSAHGFDMMSELLTTTLGKLIILTFAAAFIYHVLAGIRHMLMDMGLGEHLPAGRYTARVIIFLAVSWMLEFFLFFSKSI